MATYQNQMGKTIQHAFEIYDVQNPKIWELFKKFALQILEKRKHKAKNKTSAKLIIERIRWEIYVETISDDGYKINDAWSSRYARKFADEFPEHATLFNYRSLRSE